MTFTTGRKVFSLMWNLTKSQVSDENLLDNYDSKGIIDWRVEIDFSSF